MDVGRANDRENDTADNHISESNHWELPSMEQALLVIIASKKQDPRYWYCQPKEALACDMAVDVHVRVPCPSEFVRFRVPVPPNDWRIILARKTNQRGNKKEKWSGNNRECLHHLGLYWWQLF